MLAQGIDYEPLTSMLKVTSGERSFDSSERDNRIEVGFPCTRNLLTKPDGIFCYKLLPTDSCYLLFIIVQGM
jgi:hypothetical protein